MLRTRTFECLACSAPLEFAAGSTSTRCATCGEDRPLPLRIADDVGDVEIAGPNPPPEAIADRILVQCSACKAIVSAPTEVPACPFCDAATSVPEKMPRLFRPHGILARLVDEHTARAAAAHALERARIASGVPRLQAVHLPCLLVSCVVVGEYEGRRGEKDSDGPGYHWRDVSGRI